MGANMIMYFLQWVTSNHSLGGHGRKDWVDKYIDSFIPVGGPLLGAPKVIPMYLFGEALETAPGAFGEQVGHLVLLHRGHLTIAGRTAGERLDAVVEVEAAQHFRRLLPGVR